MSNMFRASRVWSNSFKLSHAKRSFHSPFAVLGTTHSYPPSIASNVNVYEKQVDFSPEPVPSVGGQRTYVVSEPDPANTYYQVPAGAYPTSLPYVNFTATEAPNQEGQMSSTSSSLAHPVLTQAAPHNEDGVGESSAIRHATAPGSMGQRGGSHGGQGLAHDQGTHPGQGSLADRNPPPIDRDVVEKFSRMGLKDAWKARK
ncbi:hypothetical protein J3R30DRAFT_3467695 [Lentinula aciculospora]|uniref:Uncharacterized protein n=1 Tax=Lentinula aciculospora TaxID=153920 RepID=A0A9W9DPG1_9AGAR|nr:hypothetical protein J3R30DRAFT_3467695 [Lentinula aciculospora]